jgi:hypothetical protein
MSVVYLLLGGPDADEKCKPYIGGMITPAVVFSASTTFYKKY